MVRFSEFFAASALVLGVSASAVVDLIPSNFDDIVLKSGKPALVEFFAPWCGHCKTLAPVYEELASAFESSKDKVTIAKVDADAEKDLGKRFGVQGFPTLKWFDGKSDKPQDYSGGRDLESLTKFVTDKSGIKAKKARVQPSLVEMLNTKTFKEQIGKGKSAIVAFTAPWCGHCKTLAPVWEKLAHDFSLEKDVLIAKVDCEAENAKDLAKEFGVSGYPTIKYFAKDSTEGVDYSGARSQDALVNFMNEKAGTFRTVGGKLNDLAGTIPSLDSIVATLKSGGQTAYDELEKAAGGLTSGYAKYYSKVGKKALENKDYVANELTRLTNILKKGGLAPAKMDEITLRSNILTKFANSASEKVAEAVESAKEAVNSVKEEL